MLSVSQPSQQTLHGIRELLGQRVAICLQEIAARTEQVKRDFLTDRSLLDSGVWYPIDYAKALQQTNQSKRLEFLQEKKHLVHGYVSKKFFEPVLEKNKEARDWSFLVCKDKLPSEALKAAVAGLSILDCGSVCQIARYKALLDVLGDAKFNRLFSEPYGVRMNIGYEVDDEFQPMRYFVDFTQHAHDQKPGTIGNRALEVGQIVAFHGVEEYKEKHPCGMGGNYNLACLNSTPGSQLYIGHGLPSQGANEHQIARIMIDEFNEQPNHYIRLAKDAHEVMHSILKVKQIWHNRTIETPSPDNPLPIACVRGFDYGSAQDFRVHLIYDLMQAPLSQVSMEYVNHHPDSTKCSFQQNGLEDLKALINDVFNK